MFLKQCCEEKNYSDKIEVHTSGCLITFKIVFMEGIIRSYYSSIMKLKQL